MTTENLGFLMGGIVIGILVLTVSLLNWILIEVRKLNKK